MPTKLSNSELAYMYVDSTATTDMFGEFCKMNFYGLFYPEVEKIIKNKRTTIVFWDDGTKTMVRRAEGTEDDEYFAFASALAKKIYGNNSRIHKLLKEKTVWQESRKNTKTK